MYNFEIIEKENNLNVSNNKFPSEFFVHEEKDLFEENGLIDNYPFKKFANNEKDFNKNEYNSFISFDNFFGNGFNMDINFQEDENLSSIIQPKFKDVQEKGDINGIFQNLPKIKTTDYKTREISFEEQKIIKNITNISESNLGKKKGINGVKNIQKSKKKYFNINKVNKNVGRLKKKLKKLIKGKHDKFSQDNIIRKIKACFHTNILNYINKKYETYLKNINQKKYIKFLQKISPKEYQNINKYVNLRWFSSKLKVVFSGNLSSKCSSHSSDYNKRQIDKLYKKAKIQSLIDIFEKTIKEMYEIYVKDIKLDGFETLEDDLKNLQNKMEKEDEESIEEYLKEYKYVAQNLEQIFKEKKAFKK